MELKLINQELCESRLYRTTNSLSRLNGRNIADLLYLNTLAVYLMLQDDKQHDYATEYAKKTVQYGSYNNFKTVATDLYMLCYVIQNVDNTIIKLNDHVHSIKFIRSLQFDSHRHYMFTRIMAREEDTRGIANSFFLRLESQLNIKESNYKQYRRDIAVWGDLEYSIKQRVLKMIVQDIRKIAMIGELLVPLGAMLKYDNLHIDIAHRSIKNESINESASDNKTQGHPDGTYSAAIVTEMSTDKIIEWCKENNIECNTEDKLHCTIVYSKKPVPELMKFNDRDVKLVAAIDGWDLFGDAKDCLVLKIKSTGLNKWNSLMTGYGAISDYDSYESHVTINSKYSGDIPSALPDFKIAFDKIEVNPLIDDYYEKDDEEVDEAVYPGNLGFEEMMKFFKMSSKTQKNELQFFIDHNEKSKAWDLIYKVTGVKLNTAAAESLETMNDFWNNKTIIT